MLFSLGCLCYEVTENEERPAVTLHASEENCLACIFPRSREHGSVDDLDGFMKWNAWHGKQVASLWNFTAASSIIVGDVWSTVHWSVGRPFRRQQHHPPNMRRLFALLFFQSCHSLCWSCTKPPNIVDGLASEVKKTNKHGVLWNQLQLAVVDQLVSKKRKSPSIPAALFSTLVCLLCFSPCLSALVFSSACFSLCSCYCRSCFYLIAYDKKDFGFLEF